MQYYSQRYSYFFHMPKREHNHSKFCSELVSEVYAQIGRSLNFGREHYECAPGDLEDLIRDETWVSVTESYVSYYSGILKKELDLERGIEAAEIELAEAKLIRGQRELTRFKCGTELRLLRLQIKAYGNEKRWPVQPTECLAYPHRLS